MKPETTRGARRLVPRRRRDRSRLSPLGELDVEARSADPMEFDPAEFAEFLDADEGTLPVDPAFRDRLRDELWGMVQAQAERRRDRPGPPARLDPKRTR